MKSEIRGSNQIPIHKNNNSEQVVIGYSLRELQFHIFVKNKMFCSKNIN